MARRPTRENDDERLGSPTGADTSAQAQGGAFDNPLIPQVDPDAEDFDDVVTGDHAYARGDEREDRGHQEREHGEREISEAERLELFRLSMYQNQLPSLPPMPGYHLCWLTTQNPRDSIQGRIRLGYELIKADELPGWEANHITSGSYAGCVGVNEMVAAKLPLRLYEMYMTEAHHNQPLAEEGKLRATLDAIADSAKNQHKARVEQEEGTAQLGKSTRRARFEEIHGVRRSVLEG